MTTTTLKHACPLAMTFVTTHKSVQWLSYLGLCYGLIMAH